MLISTKQDHFLIKYDMILESISNDMIEYCLYNLTALYFND